MSYNTILLMIGAAVIAHCFFLILVLIRLSQKLANRLLSGLLFFLAVRIGVCIGGLVYEDFQLVGTYIGGLCVAMIGPLFYFYQHSLWNPSFRFMPKDAYHLAPAAMILAVVPFLNVKILFAIFAFTLLSMVVYVVLGFRKLNATAGTNRLDDVRWKWAWYFSLGIAAILVLFLGQLLFFRPYIYNAIVTGSALVCYLLSWWAVKHVRLFMREPLRKNGQQAQVLDLGKRIEEVLKNEEMFTNPLMNVSLLANHLKVPAYLVSQAVNDYFKRGFPEILNTLRIRKAEQLLLDSKKSHYTIEAIAYESGFSTLSAFYSMFKKVTLKTPAQYRKYKSGFGDSQSVL